MVVLGSGFNPGPFHGLATGLGQQAPPADPEKHNRRRGALHRLSTGAADPRLRRCLLPPG